MEIVGASGSSIFMTGSAVVKFDIQFPSWSVDDQKNYYPYSIAAKLQTAYYPPKYSRASYQITASGGGYLAGGVTAPNGAIYCIPGAATNFLKIMTTGSVETYSYISSSIINDAAETKFGGAALASNASIYCVPYSDQFRINKVVKIDTTNDTISLLGNLPSNFNAVFVGAVCAPNGYVYGIPHSISYVLKINPFNDTFSTFGSLSGASLYYGGTLAPNGVIYCAPHNSRFILKIDTNTDTLSYIDTGRTGTAKYSGAVLAPNNECIYFIPNNETGSLKIDPRTDQITYVNAPGSTAFGNIGGIAGPDGMIYGIGSAQRVVINPYNDTITAVSTFSGYQSLALGFNGAIYGIPNGSTRPMKLVDNRTYDLDPNFILSRYRNKSL